MTDNEDEVDTEVSDDVAGHRFVLVQDGVEAQLVYRAGGDRLVLTHTEVPDELGGHGIAGRLVEAAVARAARTGEVVVPQCPYTRSWLEKHPEAAASITVDWDGTPAP